MKHISAAQVEALGVMVFGKTAWQARMSESFGVTRATIARYASRGAPAHKLLPLFQRALMERAAGLFQAYDALKSIED